MLQTFMIVGVAVLAFLMVAGLMMAFSGSGGQERAVRRAQAIGAGGSSRDVRRARVTSQVVNSADTRRRQILKSLKDQERQQKKARLTLANKISQAGFSITVPQFWMGGAAFGVLIFLTMLFLRVNVFVALAFGGAAALGFPLWMLDFLAKRRTKKFTGAFSDAMDIIVRGIKSGLPVHDCLKIITRESAEPLRSEFTRLVENIGMGMTLDQALDKLMERMPTAEVRFFAIVMNIQQKSGGNLSEALNNLSMVLRSRKLMREKIKALSSEATASALIIGSMPPGVILMIMVTTPSYMAPMFADHRGWLMLGGSALWMGIGIFVMARMINFKF